MTELELMKQLLVKCFEKRNENISRIFPDELIENGDYKLFTSICNLLQEDGLIKIKSSKTSTGLYMLLDYDMTLKGLNTAETLSEKKNNNHLFYSKTLGGTCIMEKIKIFISHSSEDKEFAESFVDLVKHVFDGIKQNDIRCTSVEGYKYQTGTDFLNGIKYDAEFCDVIILLGSVNYLESKISMFEAGIAWYLDKAKPIIIEEDLGYKEFPIPLSIKEMKRANKKNELFTYFDEISKTIGIPLISGNLIYKYIEKFIDNHY